MAYQTLHQIFYNWINNKQPFITQNEIITEKFILIPETDSTHGCVSIWHDNPNKCLGQIELHDGDWLYFEVLDYNTDDTLTINHSEVNEQTNFDSLFSPYFESLFTGKRN